MIRRTFGWLGLILLSAGVGCTVQPIAVYVVGGAHGQPVPSLRVERCQVDGATDAVWKQVASVYPDGGQAIAIPYIPGRNMEDVRLSAPDYETEQFRIDWSSRCVTFFPGGRFYVADADPFRFELRFNGVFEEDSRIVRLYAQWGAVLKQIVVPGGSIRWDIIKSDAQLRDSIIQIAREFAALSPLNHPEHFRDPPNVRLAVRQRAYWVNAYNVLSVLWVIQHQYPPDILFVRTDAFQIGDSAMTLQQIAQHAIHDGGVDGSAVFGMSGCSRSSPPLRDEPYVGDRLSQQLHEQARVYLRDPRALVVDGKIVRLNDLLLANWEVLAISVGRQHATIDPNDPIGGYPVWALCDGLSGLAGYAGYGHEIIPSSITSNATIGRLGFDRSLNAP